MSIGNSAAARFTPFLLSMAPLLGGCQQQAINSSPEPDPELAFARPRVVIELSRDIVPSLATLVGSDDKLNQILHDLQQIPLDDYATLKGRLVKATQGNRITNAADIHRIFQDLRVNNTGELDESILKELVHFLKQAQARSLIERLYHDLDPKEREHLKTATEEYLKTNDGKKLTELLDKFGVKVETPLYSTLSNNLVILLLLITTLGGIGAYWKREDILAQMKPRNGAADLKAIHKKAPKA